MTHTTVTAAEMKALEKAANDNGLLYIQMMENAGRAAFAQLRRRLPGPARLLVAAGRGNNGGDGVAAARILRGMGFRVRAFLVGDRRKMTPDERAMEKKLEEAGGVLEEFRPEDRRQMLWLSLCGCLVDALFGVGLSRPVEGDALLAVRLMQKVPAGAGGVL